MRDNDGEIGSKKHGFRRLESFCIEYRVEIER